jgi:hypothetical protein
MCKEQANYAEKNCISHFLIINKTVVKYKVRKIVEDPSYIANIDSATDIR